MPRASSLAADIERETGVVPILIAGESGIFDVVVDGRRVFSKHDVGRFPEPLEILDKLRG